MTLLSRPVLGQVPGQCFTASVWASMPTSHHKAAICSGHTPGYWVLPLNFGSWVAPYYPDTVTGVGGHTPTLFNAVFSPSTYASTTTLVGVLALPVGQDDVARYIVAALLNAAAGLAPPLPINTVQGIWREYASTGGGALGYFEPTAGVKWFQADIVRYLLSTMPL
jgi:hypothetical protein